MRVVVVGASKVGIDFVKWFCREGYDVVVIDKEPEKIDYITDAFDCNGFVGNGSSRVFLKNAGVGSAAMFIAVTKDDEANILCCHIAKELGVKKTAAAVRDPWFVNDLEYIEKDLGVDIILNPDQAAAKSLGKLAKYAGAIEIEQFSAVNVNIASIVVTEESKLVGIDAKRAAFLLGENAKICFIDRKGNILRFDSDYFTKAGDRLFVSTTASGLVDVLHRIDIKEKSGKTVIVGGGKIGYFLLQVFSGLGRKITLIEKDIKRCRELLETFPMVHIVTGDGTDADFIGQCLEGADACIAVTGSDDKNLVISMFAKGFGVERIAAEIQNDDYEMVMKKSGIAHAFSKQDVVVSRLLKEARLLSVGLDKDSKDALKWLNILELGRVEACLFDVDESFKLCNVMFGDKHFTLKKGISIAAIYRNETAIIPKDTDCIEPGDRIVVISANIKLSRLSDITL